MLQFATFLNNLHIMPKVGKKNRATKTVNDVTEKFGSTGVESKWSGGEKEKAAAKEAAAEGAEEGLDAITKKFGSTGVERRLMRKRRRVGTPKQETQRKKSADYPNPPVVNTGPRAKTPATKPIRPTASATRGRVKRPTGKVELPAQLKGRLKSGGYGQ